MFDAINPILKKIIQSFFITFSISLLGALFLLNFNFNFIVSFSFIFILQFVLFYFYGEHVKRKNAYILAQLELQAASELKKITADVICPCDRKVQTTIPIDMNSDNSYICGQCSKKVKVLIDVKTVLKTDPVIEDPLKNPQFLKNVNEVLKDPSHNDRF
jgi:hypothetical protein